MDTYHSKTMILYSCTGYHINVNLCQRHTITFKAHVVTLKAIFQNNSTNSDSSYNEIDSDISINSDYNKNLGSQHVNNNIISKPVPQVIDEVIKSANAKELSVAVNTQTNFYSSIQYDQPVHVCDIVIGADF